MKKGQFQLNSSVYSKVSMLLLINMFGQAKTRELVSLLPLHPPQPLPAMAGY